MYTRLLLAIASLGLCSSLLAQSAVLDPTAGTGAGSGFEEANRRAGLPRWLSLKFAEFDTAGAPPVIPVDLTTAPGLPEAVDYFLVQVAGPVTELHKQALAALGLELFDYVPNHAFIVRGSRNQVQGAEATGVTVWSQPFHPAYRIDPVLLAETESKRVAVLGFRGIDAATLNAQAVAAGATVHEEHDAVDRRLLIASATPAVMRALARSRDVQWVEPESVVTERNDTMTWTVQTGVANDRKIWTKGLHGEGQVIGHQDGGIATTACYFSDPVNPIGPLHRKIVYRSGTGTNSHGTHTAGTAAGDAFPINGSTANRGLAYAAKLAHSSDYSGAAFSARATTHSTNGARFHTNSWGNDGTTAYDSLCNSIDAFSWTNEDNLVFFAETNLSTLKNPENAKNLVAVGNAQNGANYNTKCGGGVGPTADGRRKPDLFTPGCSIVSAGTSSCSTSTLTGTSMASPSATAAAALIRQYFVNGFYPSGIATPADSFVPTGALTKAVLINTCQDMTGVAGYPSDTEGWGRVVLDESLHFAGDLGSLWVVDVRRAVGLTTGTSRTVVVNVTGANRPLEVTLAFTDFAGTVNSSNPVVNDLDLLVTAPNGVQYRGNAFSGGWSLAGSLVVDTKNNVERVAVLSPIAGTWTFQVTATAVPQGPQGFGLCATGMISGGFSNAAIEIYGTGKPGALGVPVISAPLPLLPSTWPLQVSATQPNLFGILVYGDNATMLPFDGGTVLADPLLLLIQFTTPAGSINFPVTIPPDPSLNGSSTYWQWWMPNDPGAAGAGWSASRGLHMTMGN
ncbi:MAG: S8 family serine peptidase [Planctomycetota bacterium]